MLKFLAKVAEKYGKVSGNACSCFIFHQPKKPTSLIEKD